MQPNAVTPQFRAFHLILQIAVFAGMMLPFGEILGPWLVMKIARPKTSEKLEAGRRLIAFQASWSIFRIITMLGVALFWINAATPDVPYRMPAPEIPKGQEFSIPGEPTPGQSPQVEPLDPLRQAREDRSLLDKFKFKPEVFLFESLFTQPRVVMITLAGIAFSFFLWFISMSITALNVLVVLREGRPWYPLTLPWLKSSLEKKLGPEFLQPQS